MIVNLLDHFTKPGRLRVSIRAYLALLVAIVMLPALVIAWWVTSGSAETERRQLEQDGQAEMREIGAAIDREIVALQNTITVLAGSVHLKEGDFAGFHRIAMSAARLLDATIMLRDLRIGQQVVSTAYPWGTSLADEKSTPRDAFEEELLRAGKVAVSNVFVGKLTGRPVVRITVPVVQDGNVDFLLSVSVPLRKFAEILGTLKIGTGQLATVIDRGNTIVARSQRNEEFAGTALAIPMSEWRSVGRSVNREGIAFHWFNRRSDLTGWIVSVGVPDSVLDAPGRRAYAYFAAAGGLAFLFSLALSYPLARRLSETSGALGIDRTPTREEFEVLFESAPNGVLVADQVGRIILLNAQMERKFGYRRDELIGQPVELLIPERCRGAHARHRTSFMGATEARAMGAERELFGLRKDGTEFPIEVGLNPIKTTTGILVMATVVDITARKCAAERLTAALTERDDLRRRFLRAQEEERLRLAHELHDQTGQGLTAVMIELKGLEAHVRESDRERIRLLRLQLERLGRTLHDVAWELRPASMDELGLASALSEYVSVWSAQYGIDADFLCDDRRVDGLTDEVRTTIYRVVQEGLTNIAKHAPEATSVSVVIERVENTVRVIIEDDGSGFDPVALPSAARDRGGLGLAGMRERLALIGGEVEIESSAGAGTTIFARIPIESDRMVA
jgi:PAS domain S-box-containing protein